MQSFPFKLGGQIAEKKPNKILGTWKLAYIVAMFCKPIKIIKMKNTSSCAVHIATLEIQWMGLDSYYREKKTK